jgi:hypothetical protein
MSRAAYGAVLFAGFSVGAFALTHAQAQAAEVSVPMSVLKKCADITEQLKRLACYDQVAERPAAPMASTAPAAPSAAAAGAATTKAAPAAPGAAPAKETFGLYSVEHPAPPPAVEALITAKVVSLGSNSRGHSTVTLEGDQVWELDGGDPLLRAGETVTVKRGTLGSFILTTAGGRLHRVHRVR